MSKILLYCADTVGKSMAGPAIRYWEMAHALAKSHQVILMTPNKTEVTSDLIEIIPHYNKVPMEVFQRADVIITQTISWKMAFCAKKKGIRIILDAYNPILLEVQEMLKSQSAKQRELRSTQIVNNFNFSFNMADSLICASEKQRDLWLGSIMALNLIKPEYYDKDPTLRNLIDVVPFGLSSERPQKKGIGLKEKFSLKVSDKVLLWGGGIWEWFDPLSLIKAIKILSLERKDIKLVFMGIKHPNESIEQMTMSHRAIDLAKELDLLDKEVFFNYGWTPYQERQNYLLESSIGVSTHFDHLETRFSFRTRILDYIWSNLPILCTEGDSFAEKVKNQDLGLVVPYRDASAIASAIKQIIDHPDQEKRMKENLEKLRAKFVWEEVIRPIENMIDHFNAMKAPTYGWKEKKMIINHFYLRLALKRQEVGTAALISRGFKEGLKCLMSPFPGAYESIKRKWKKCKAVSSPE